MHSSVSRVLLGLLVIPVALWGADRYEGRWKLNVEKSNYGSLPAPKSSIGTFVAERDGLKYTADGVNAKGEATHVEYTAKYDGKDYPITGSSTIDTVAVKRVDADTREWTLKKGGQVVITARSVLSKDGKTLTTTWKAKDEKGVEVTWTTVAEKQ